jgi:hypothetical protein
MSEDTSPAPTVRALMPLDREEPLKGIKQSELNRLVQQLKDLREALAPFAFFGSSLPPIDPEVQRITTPGRCSTSTRTW